MATKTNPDNRIQEDYENKFNGTHGAPSPSGGGLSPDDLEKLENYANTGDETRRGDDPASDIDKTREREKAGSGWKSNVTGNNKQKAGGKLKGWRKKGPMATIIALLFGGGAGFSIMIAPGIGIVQLKEIMAESLNDQLAAMDIRNDYMFRAKLKSLQGGFSICSEKVTMRCKFATLSDSRVKAMKEAGFTFEPAEPDRRFKRLRPTSITFPDGTKVTNPQQIKDHLKNNPSAVSDLHRGFMNPKFTGLYDKAANKVFGLFKADRSQKIKGTTQEAQDEAMQQAISSAEADIDFKPTQTDAEGREYVTASNGDRIYREQPERGTLPIGSTVDPDEFDRIAEVNRRHIAEINGSAENARSTGRGSVGRILRSGFKGINLIGAADTACTVYNLGRAVSAAAKATRAIQLFQYALVFFNVADRIKAGEATPEEVTYVGDKLTAVDTHKTVEDESGILGAHLTDGKVDSAETEPQPNPYYGYNAFDSPGYKVAAYNEAPILTSRDIQYMIGGGFAGTLSKAMDGILDTLGVDRKDVRKTCSVVQSWWARTAGLIAGIFAAVGSFGVTTALSIGASVAIGFAMPFFEAALADIMAGKTVTPDTKGVDTGDAVFAGSGALFGGMAMGHGMTPANSGQIKDYTAIANQVKAKHVAVETYEARDTPFDIHNQYSFLGSLVRKVNPALLQANAGVSSALVNIPSLLGTAVSSLVPNTGAATVFNPDRFKRCQNDEGYAELGIDADVFCNVRYVGLGLNIEPDEAVTWMIENGHIEDDEEGTPKSDDYKDWIEYCTERTDGFGETSNDDDNSDKAIGKTCVTKDKSADEITQLEYFSAYFMFAGLQDVEDNGYQTGAAAGNGGAQTSEATPEMCKTLEAGDLAQIACKAYQFDNYGYLWGGGHGGTAKKFMEDFKAGKAKAGQDAILDCSGLVRMAIYDATGVDIGGMATGGYTSYSKFKEVPKDQAKAGDILWRADHTEILVKNDVSGKRFHTFGAHTAKSPFDEQIGPTTAAYSRYDKVFRFQN